MAIAATLDTYNAAVDKLGVEYVDWHGVVRTITTDIKQGIVQADIETLVGLLDPLTHCRICEVMVNSQTYVISGGQAADNAAHWFEIYQQAELDFRSAARCRQTARFIVPGPTDLWFTGQDQILVDPNNVTVAALEGWLAVWLKTRTYGGLNDFTVIGGQRTQSALPVPNVR